VQDSNRRFQIFQFLVYDYHHFIMCLKIGATRSCRATPQASKHMTYPKVFFGVILVYN